MKILLFALDGLEYNLVERWNLNSLKQKIYGRIYLDISYMIKSIDNELVPYTPIVWTSVLTGLRPGKHKQRELYSWGKILDIIRHNPLIARIKNKRRLLFKLGFYPKPFKINFPTLFDIIKPSIAIYFIGYNLDENWFRLSFMDLHKVSDVAWKITEFRTKLLEKYLYENWRLLGVYYEITDWFGHCYIKKNWIKLYNAYKYFDKLIEKLSFLLQDTLIIILSDHGMKLSKDGVSGTHTAYMFYSLNKDLNWKPRDATDIYNLIIRMCDSNDP